ncbi:MAG TPA: glycosyltransferase family 4 protein [Vicinamibacteria bacterium]|nr:glycosyltransferase family 4 protein [Vicinamibacteria bacterium]
MKLEIWSPLPPARSGVADHVAETLPHLVRRAEVGVVVPDPSAVDRSVLAGAALRTPDESDPESLRLYALGNSHWHSSVYRESLRRPGVLLLHEWSLHGLVLAGTFLRGDAPAYVRRMREGYGTTGTALAGQVMDGFSSPLLESLFPLSEHVVERSRAVAATTGFTAARAARVRPDLPVRHVPLHASLPLDPLPSRAEARRALGLPEGALVVTAPGLVNPLKRLDVALRVAGRLRNARPGLLCVVAGENVPALPLHAWAREAGLGDGFVLTGRLSLPDLVRHLVAADVVLALRFPSLGEMSAVLLRALAAGRPAVVTAGTPAGDEFPEGVVVPVDPGRYEEAELEAVLGRLLDSPELREAIGARARTHAHRHHDPERLAGDLLDFLEEAARAPLPPPAAPEEAGPRGDLLADLRRAARELGLPAVPEDVRRRAEELVGDGSGS